MLNLAALKNQAHESEEYFQSILSAWKNILCCTQLGCYCVFMEISGFVGHIIDEE